MHYYQKYLQHILKNYILNIHNMVLITTIVHIYKNSLLVFFN